LNHLQGPFTFRRRSPGSGGIPNPPGDWQGAACLIALRQCINGLPRATEARGDLLNRLMGVQPQQDLGTSDFACIGIGACNALQNLARSR
jgi:hypothetical protein